MNAVLERPALHSWWRINTTGAIVEVRKVREVKGETTCTVHYLNENAQCEPTGRAVTVEWLNDHASPVRKAGK